MPGFGKKVDEHVGALVLALIKGHGSARAVGELLAPDDPIPQATVDVAKKRAQPKMVAALLDYYGLSNAPPEALLQVEPGSVPPQKTARDDVARSGAWSPAVRAAIGAGIFASLRQDVSANEWKDRLSILARAMDEALVKAMAIGVTAAHAPRKNKRPTRPPKDAM